jgi:hypothetical protein
VSALGRGFRYPICPQLAVCCRTTFQEAAAQRCIKGKSCDELRVPSNQQFIYRKILPRIEASRCHGRLRRSVRVAGGVADSAFEEDGTDIRADRVPRVAVRRTVRDAHCDKRGLRTRSASRRYALASQRRHWMRLESTRVTCRAMPANDYQVYSDALIIDAMGVETSLVSHAAVRRTLPTRAKSTCCRASHRSYVAHPG